jgi:hypothetical protein
VVTSVGDLRQGFRQFLRQPAFSAAAVGSLAIGIGVTTALFCVVNAVLLRSAPVRQPDRLVEIYSGFPDYPQLTNSYPDYVSIRERADVFQGVAAHSWVRAVLTGGERPRLVTGSRSAPTISTWSASRRRLDVGSPPKRSAFHSQRP